MEMVTAVRPGCLSPHNVTKHDIREHAYGVKTVPDPGQFPVKSYELFCTACGNASGSGG